MHILHIGTEKSWRGGENQVRLLIEGLNKAGIENSLAYPKNSRALEQFSGKLPLITLTSTNPLSPRSIYRVVRYCRQEKVDIIDAHSAKAHQLGLAIKIFLPQIKLVVHRRVDNLPSNSIWTKKRYLSDKVDHYTAISEKIRSILLEYGVAPQKLGLAYSAIDVDKYRGQSKIQSKQDLLQKLALPSNHFLIGNASALTSQKGYETLLLALAKLNREQAWTALIAGEGHLEAELKEMSRKLGLEDRVQFLGFIDYVPKFLLALDLLCVPSNNEGLGTLILDALAAGTPVVATAVGGIPEIIESELNGLLVEKGDSVALAQAIQRVMTDAALSESFVHQGYIRLKERFSLANMVQANLTIYKKLLGILT